MTQFDYDLIVIGSGAGGSVAAAIAAHNKKRVALIESNVLGGDSANFGDVPTQTLLNVARIYGEARSADVFGIRSGMVGYNYPTIKAWKDRVVARVGEGGSKRYYESLGVQVILGLAHFISPSEITVNRRHISAAHIIVATGAEWTIPEIQGLQKLGYLTPRSALDLIRPPKSLFVIGGGTTGLELTRLFSTFGTKVYISEIAPRLLPREDQEVGELIANVLSNRNGVTPLVGTRVIRVSKDGLGRRVHYLQGHEEKSVRVDEVLVASGKTPRVDIGLENAGITYSPRGIEVNEHLQTAAKHIFAAGDVLGGFGLTHVALMESRIAAHNILHKNKVSPDYKAVPRISYVIPEVASVGYSEDDLIKRDLDYQKSMVPISIIGRSNISNQRDGFVKILADKKTRRILGATVVTPNAGEVIHELTLAIQHDLTVDAVASTLHAFPSWSEAVRIACAKV
jgi:dihydrolipoamide dehydrogenase